VTGLTAASWILIVASVLGLLWLARLKRDPFYSQRCPRCQRLMTGGPSGVQWYDHWVCTTCAPIVQSELRNQAEQEAKRR